MELKWTSFSDEMECACLIGRKVNNARKSDMDIWQGTEYFRAEQLEQYPDCGELLEHYLGPVQEAEDYVFSHLEVPEEELNFFFRQDISGFQYLGYCLETLWELEARPDVMEAEAWKEAIFHLTFQLATEKDPFAEMPPMPSDTGEMLALLEKVHGPDQRKWKLAMLYQNGAEYQARVHEILEQAAVFYREKKHLLVPLVEEARDRLRAGVEAEGGDYLFRTFHIRNSGQFQEIAVSAMGYSLIWLETSQLLEEESARDRLGVGILAEPLMRLTKRKQDNPALLVEMIRALNDKNRLEILSALKGKSLCGQELAEHLGVTPATVSHHMNLLIDHNLVAVEKEGTRVNYRYLPEGISNFIESLREFLL